MIDINALKTPSLTKKMIFFIISFFSGVYTLFFISPENFFIFGGGVFLSLSSAIVLSSLLHTRYLLFILPFLFWGIGKFISISNNTDVFLFSEWGILFFSVGVFFIMNSFHQSYKEKIKIQFFQDSFSAFKSGGIFIILSIGLFVFSSSFQSFGALSSSSSQENTSEIIIQKILKSDEVSSLIDSLMSSDMLEEQRIEAQKVCRGNVQCINRISEEFEREKDKAKVQLESELEKSIKKFTSPQLIQDFLKEERLPYGENISIESLQIILIFIIAFFSFLPLVPLFGLLGAIFFSFFFLALVFFGRISLGKISLKKEVMY